MHANIGAKRMKLLSVLLYRLNAFLLLFILSVVIAWIASPFWYDHHRLQVGGISVPESSTNPKGLIYFDEVYAITGTPFERVALMAKFPSSLWGQIGNSDEVRNLLILEKDYASARWLFHDQANTIVRVAELETPATALYLEYRKPEQSGLFIAVAMPDGSQFTDLLTGVERVLEYHITLGGKLLVLYQNGLILHRARFDLPGLSKIDDIELMRVALPSNNK
jgi:hypothetical protein